MKTSDSITALAPAPEPFEQAWSEATLAAILADDQAPTRTPWWRSTRGRVAVLGASGVLAVSAGTAVAGEGPAQVVKDFLLDFSNQPSTTANGMGALGDPVQVARFETRDRVFAVWVATSSNGTVCHVNTTTGWDGVGVPEPDEMESSCAGMVLDHGDPDRVVELVRPEQIGGFFTDAEGPLAYGISPYPDAAFVHLQGPGVDRTLPVRPDSHGFGAALPEAAGVDALRLTWVDDSGRVLGSERWVAPVG